MSIFGIIGMLIIIVLVMVAAVIGFIWFVFRKKKYDITKLLEQRLYTSAELSCRAGIKDQYLYIGGQGLKYVIGGFIVLDWLDSKNKKSDVRQIVITTKKRNFLPYWLPMSSNKQMIRCDTSDIEGDVNELTGDVTLKAVDLKKRDFYMIPIKRWDDAPVVQRIGAKQIAQPPQQPMSDEMKALMVKRLDALVKQKADADGTQDP
jgi:hypothetical protein